MKQIQTAQKCHSKTYLKKKQKQNKKPGQRFLALNQAERDQVDRDMEVLLASFGTHLGESPESPEVQALVERLQAFLDKHFYECTPAILRSLANMCDGGGSVTENLDALGGPGTARLIAQALRCYAAD